MNLSHVFRRTMLVMALLPVLSVAAQEAPAGAAAKIPLGREVEYKKPGGVPLHLYISSPKDDGKLHPAIVFIHGGGWTMGSVTQFSAQSQYFASRGMVAVDVEYRLVSSKEPEAPKVCGEDAKSAMRWVRAHAKELHIDPNRIVGAGGSAGGYLAAFTALVPGWDDPADDLSISPKPNVLILYFPVLDLSPNGYGNKRFGPEGSVTYSPETYLTKPAPPTIIFAGLADKLVHPDTLRNYKALADKAGGRCELVFYEDQPHGFANKEPYQSITTMKAAEFLESLGYLVPEKAAAK